MQKPWKPARGQWSTHLFGPTLSLLLALTGLYAVTTFLRTARDPSAPSLMDQKSDAAVPFTKAKPLVRVDPTTELSPSTREPSEQKTLLKTDSPAAPTGGQESDANAIAYEEGLVHLSPEQNETLQGSQGWGQGSSEARTLIEQIPDEAFTNEW